MKPVSRDRPDTFLRRWKGKDGLTLQHRHRTASGVRSQCAPCLEGLHSVATHGPIGCMALVGLHPRDFLCRCVEAPSE